MRFNGSKFGRARGISAARAAGLLVFALLLASASPQAPVAGPPDFFELLQTKIGVSPHGLPVTLPAGRPLAMLLPEPRSGEVGVAGVERLRVPLEFFLDGFRKMPVFKRGQQVLLIHEFSSPPNAQDLQLLRLPLAELRALPECVPGDCSVKLSAPMMEQFRGDAPGDASVGSRFQEVILQFLAQYLQKGNAAMIAYADKVPVVSSSDESHALFQEFNWLKDDAPPLYDCVAAFSGGSCPEIESFVYWSSAKFGLKPVFSITHVMIYRTMKDGRPWVYIAFKQIYADHYFDGSLGLAVLVEQSAGPADPALWILYVNRSVTDALGGWLGPVKRSITNQRSRAALQRNLVELKESFELRYDRRSGSAGH